VPLAVGETFERYEIESLIGRGGMGEVYRATDTRLRRKVALKVLRPDRSGDEAVARLFREARAAAGLSHPNTVAIHDVGEAEGIFYIVMELVTGGPLLQYVGDDRVPVARKLGWLVDVARALSAAHKAGVIHRDVKPSNVMVSDEGIVKVLDFGLAKSLAPMSFRTQHGHSLGTPRYMSPEQMTGDEVDARSDQYAFALTAYELVAGKHPGGVLAGPEIPPPLEEVAPDVTRSVGQVIAQAMAMSPAARFESMEVVVVALEDAIAGRPVRGLRLPSVAAMSAVPETVADTMPFGATVTAAASDSDLEVDRPTITARPAEPIPTELATAPTEAKPALHHLIGATVPVGPAGTLIDAGAMGRALAATPGKRTLKSATSAPPPAMRTLMSADMAATAPAAKEPVAAATGTSALAEAPPSAPAPASAPARKKSPLLAVGMVVLALVTFGGAYVGAKKLASDATSPTSSAGSSESGASRAPSLPPPPATGASAAASAAAIAPPHGTLTISPLVAPATAATESSSAAAPKPIPTPIPTPTPRPAALRPKPSAAVTATVAPTAPPTLDMKIR